MNVCWNIPGNMLETCSCAVYFMQQESKRGATVTTIIQISIKTQTTIFTSTDDVVVCGRGQRSGSYLDGGHLGVTSPAEVHELQRAVAEAHGAAVQRGSLLDLELQMMEVGEEVSHARPERRCHERSPSVNLLTTGTWLHLSHCLFSHRR